MLYFRGLIFAILVSFLSTWITYGQKKCDLTNNSKEFIIELSEKKYGLDDLLVNGIQYKQENIRANGNPNFEWGKIGTKLFIKGHAYNNLDLDYDICIDQLVLTEVQKNLYKLQTILNYTFVDSFRLGNKVFINLTMLNEDCMQEGYFEKVSVGKELFLRKHHKRFVDLYDLQNPNGKYSTQQSIYYIYHKKTLIKVNSLKEFVRFYDGYRKEIIRFLRKNKIKYLKASNKELCKLMTFCHDISSPNN